MKKTTREVWRQIRGFTGKYSVSSRGRVMSLNWNGVRGRNDLLKPWPHRLGHQIVGLRDGKKCKRFYVHRLVLAAFVGRCPIGFHGSHIDGNPTNNRLENLLWESPTANNRRKQKHGTENCGERQWNSKLTKKDVIWIRKSKKTIKEKAEILGVVYVTVHQIMARKAWRHVK